jgi:hypothetical protein
LNNFELKKINKIKTKLFKEIRASSWYSWKAFDEYDFLEVIPKL